jgi:hypothetical protein
MNKDNTQIKLGIYQHYKGNLYQVIGISRHSENLEVLVVYQALYGNYGLWVRPIAMFNELVEPSNIPRFRYIANSLGTAAELIKR